MRRGASVRELCRSCDPLLRRGVLCGVFITGRMDEKRQFACCSSTRVLEAHFAFVTRFLCVTFAGVQDLPCLCIDIALPWRTSRCVDGGQCGLLRPIRDLVMSCLHACHCFATVLDGDMLALGAHGSLF